MPPDIIKELADLLATQANALRDLERQRFASHLRVALTESLDNHLSDAGYALALSCTTIATALARYYEQAADLKANPTVVEEVLEAEAK